MLVLLYYKYYHTAVIILLIVPKSADAQGYCFSFRGGREIIHHRFCVRQSPRESCPVPISYGLCITTVFSALFLNPFGGIL